MASSSTIYPDQVARLDAYIPAICRIVRISDNRPLGTGFLISPGVVMTCHHVVPKAAKPGDCRAEFYGMAIVDQSDLSTRKVTYFEEIPFDPDESKCITSPQNFDKDGNLSAADADKLDYSILSLVTNPKLTKVKYFDLFRSCTGSMIEQLSTAFVFQYPDIESRDISGLWIKSHETLSSSNSKRKTKKIWTRGEFNLVTGSLRKCGEYEIHYGPETAPGSSGGPVTDSMGKLMGLHYQGQVTGCNCTKNSTAPSYCNAGVRIDKIVEELTTSGKKQQVLALIEQNRYRTHLKLFQHFKGYYKQKRTALLMTKGEDCLLPIDSVYCDLTLIKKSVEEKHEIGMRSFEAQQTTTHRNSYCSNSLDIRQFIEDIEPKNEIESKDKRKRFILYGVAGIGKTTFSEMAAIHGPEIWYSQFELVFLIKLRNLNSTNYPNRLENYSIEEVLAKEYEISLQKSKKHSNCDPKKFSCSLSELQEFLYDPLVRKNSLLILDGFDELPTEVNHGQGSLQNVIHDLEKTFDHIAITSRHCDIRFHNGVEMNWRAQFELIGFGQKSICDYIQRVYSQLEANGKIPQESNAQDKIAKLSAVLEQNPILNNFVHIPINLALTCSIFNKNETMFQSIDNSSLADFYRSAINVLYDRFLRRPGPSQSLRHNPTDDLSMLMGKRHQVLQSIAWLAMEQDQVQIGEDGVKLAFENLDIDYAPDLIKDIGIIKLEGGAWEFIHLTFQEYFAAVYLANTYIEGNVDTTKKLLAKIKFIPSYRLTLQMTVGYLSHMASQNKDNQSALQTFFDHLFDEPRDLAKSYEISLFNECFKECKTPDTITPHYCVFQSNRDSMLVSSGETSAVQISREDLVEVSTRDLIKIIEVNALERQAREEGDVAQQALNTLVISVVQNKDLADPARRKAIQALAAIGLGGGDGFKKVMKAVENLVQNQSLSSGYKEHLVVILNILKDGGETPQQMLHALIEKIRDPHLVDIFKEIALESLGDIVEAGRVCPLTTMSDLVETVHNSSFRVVEKVKKVLTSINSNILLSLIKDTTSCEVIIRVCSLTSRPFVIFEGRIYISDQRQQESVSCPQAVDIEVLEQMDVTAKLESSLSARSSFLLTPTHSSSSTSSSNSSSSSSSMAPS